MHAKQNATNDLNEQLVQLTLPQIESLPINGDTSVASYARRLKDEGDPVSIERYDKYVERMIKEIKILLNRANLETKAYQEYLSELEFAHKILQQNPEVTRG